MPPLQNKPFGFVSLPSQFASEIPIWHDGTNDMTLLSGEIRCELTNLTPMLVGWERRTIKEIFDQKQDDATFVDNPQIGEPNSNKSCLCPLRANWGARPVLLQGDSIKGLIRHELGALLGAPMERVAERSYSYRPNSMYPDNRAVLWPRLARVPVDGIDIRPLDTADGTKNVRVPVKLELFQLELTYKGSDPPYYRFDVPSGATYRGGQGAGNFINSAKKLHTSIEASPNTTITVDVSEEVQQGYLNTLSHLTNLAHGHFSDRHPESDIGQTAQRTILDAAQNDVFSPGDMVWVEWDTQNDCIVSLGWHYYYRWAYQDTVRLIDWYEERPGLFPLEDERTNDAEGAPARLSPVRRLFGYTGDNPGSEGIGQQDHEQLMGRIFVNTAIEVVDEAKTNEQRFLPPTFLKELGMPRPSAVEHYIKQPHHPHRRPWDDATLMTYGDATGYDEPGELAGRKFYLDRSDAYTGEPWKDDSEANRQNDRSTLAFEASQPQSKFRFTVRFRDLEAKELAWLIVALCPNQFKSLLGGNHRDGYCSKLGYARPLGWGSVRISVCDLLLLDPSVNGLPALRPNDLLPWMQQNVVRPPQLREWLDIHRCKHPEAGKYPTGKNGLIYTYHTGLRAQHSRDRRNR